MPANENLKRYGVYQKSLALFDLAVADLTQLAQEPMLRRLISQQIASADSISSNIEEGYGRGSRKEYAQFLVIARGSAQETAGRYARLKHWLPDAVVAARVELCHEIIGILSGSIKTLRSQQL